MPTYHFMELGLVGILLVHALALITLIQTHRMQGLRMRLHFFFLASLLSSPSLFAEQFVFHHENTLGTRMELRLECASQDHAKHAESQALGEIDRLASIFSSYDSQSELSRLLKDRESFNVSSELRDVLDASERWHRLTQGAFQPGVETLTRVWQSAERSQQLPDRVELERIAKSLGEIGWIWSADRKDVHLKPFATIQFNAIAKGYIVDSVCTLLQKSPGVDGGLLAIGGDMRGFGNMHRTILLPPPVDNLAAAPNQAVQLDNRSLATSHGAFRGVTIGGKRYSHLLDPRTGYPVTGATYVTVIANQCADADALATACSVLTPHESLALIHSLPGTACYILDGVGDVFQSNRWPNEIGNNAYLTRFQEPSTPWNGGMELKVDFSINQPEKAGRYRRPYLAVWIEGKDDIPIRTLLLWIHNTGHGQRWLPDLRRWYRADSKRTKTESLDLVATVSEATRRPGAYSVTWNGLDDRKLAVPLGEYSLCIEAAREHGTYQLMRKKLNIGTSEFREKADDNAEIKGVVIHYRQKPKAD